MKAAVPALAALHPMQARQHALNHVTTCAQVLQGVLRTNAEVPWKP